MNLFDDVPVRLISRAKQPVNQFNRSVVWTGPATIEKASVVKNDHAAWFHETAPVVPVALHAVFGVVAINHEQIDRFRPASGNLMAEFFEPYRLPARAALHDLMRRPPGEVQTAKAAQMIRIDQIELAARRHCLAQRQSGNAFGYANFDQRMATLGPALQRGVFLRGMLSDRGAQTQPGVNRMSESLNALARILQAQFRFARQIEHR